MEYGDDAVNKILESAPDDIQQNEDIVLKLKKQFHDRITLCISYYLQSAKDRPKRIPYYKDREDLLKKLSNRSN